MSGQKRRIRKDAKEETTSPRSFCREEDIARINRVVDYIESNIGAELSIKELAGVACFSKYHFHRIFTAMVGETLNVYIQRLRLEKAAGRLLGFPKMSVTEIALDFGFSNPSTFARAFREYFGMSATAWRAGEEPADRKNRQAVRNIRQAIRNNRKEKRDFCVYHVSDPNSSERRHMMKKKPSCQTTIKPGGQGIASNACGLPPPHRPICGECSAF